MYPVEYKDQTDEAKDLEIGKLREQVKEQKDQIQELIKSVNASAEAKKQAKTPQPATETLEYKALASQNNILQERIDELEILVKKEMKTNPAIGFQPASAIANSATKTDQSANTVANSATVIEFPANLLGKFFIASRNAKQTMKLNLELNKVKTWEVE